MLLAGYVNAQNSATTDKLCNIFPVKDGKVIYTDVVQVDSTKKEKIYSQTKLWIADHFKSTKAVIDLDDKEGYTIVAKFYFEQLHEYRGGSEPCNVWQTLSITAKDGRFKYTLSDFYLRCIPRGANDNSPYVTNTYITECVDHTDKRDIKFYTDLDFNIKANINDLINFIKSNQSDKW